MQVILLETVLLTNGEDAVDCVYDDSDVSGFVTLAVLLMTIIVKVPIDFALVINFMVLMAKPHVELEHRKVVNEIVKKRWSSLQLQESFRQGNVTKSSERRRGDFVMNTERSGYGIGMPKNTRLVVWRSLYVSKVPALLMSGCSIAWYDIYKVYMKLDPHSAIVPETVHRTREHCVDALLNLEMMLRLSANNLNLRYSELEKGIHTEGMMMLKQLWKALRFRSLA